MKKQLLAIVLIAFSTATIAQTTSTTEAKESKLQFLVNAKLGFAKVKQTGNVTINGNVNGGDVLLALTLSKTWNIAAGIGFLEFDANQTIAGNTVSIKNNYLHIPVQFNGEYSLFNSDPKNQKVFFTVGLGLYANTLLKQELETITETTTAKNQGWNFGFSSQFGAKFKATDNLMLGIGFEGQTDCLFDSNTFTQIGQYLRHTKKTRCSASSSVHGV